MLAFGARRFGGGSPIKTIVSIDWVSRGHPSHDTVSGSMRLTYGIPS